MSSSSSAGGLPPPKDTWTIYNVLPYATRKPLPLGLLVPKELEDKAKEKLKDYPGAYWYVAGSAGTGAAHDANIAELLKWKLIPRMLRDTTVRDIRTTVFGVPRSSPVIVGPVGVQGLLHPDGELGTARAAAKFGIPYTISSASTRTLEETVEASGSNDRWFQIYWPIDDELTISLLQRAKAVGCTTLVVTLDTPTIGYRPYDRQTAYLPFLHGWGAQLGFTDPVFMKRFNEPLRPDSPKFPYEPEKLDKLIAEGDEKEARTKEISVEWLRLLSSGKFRSWHELQIFKDNWEGPIVIKGIMSVKDAELAIDNGIDGIVVSNHGGRQVEGSVPAFWALRKICASPKVKAAQQSGKFTVIFDSGIRTGSDILKAIATGAQAVMVARPCMYALAVGGQEGVEHYLTSLLSDCELTMGLAGFKNLKELQEEGEETIVRID